MSFPCTAFQSGVALPPFHFNLAQTGQCIILPSPGEAAVSLLEPPSFVSWVSRELSKCLFWDRQCHRIHISQTMQRFFGTGIRTETEPMEWKLEDPAPKLFGHIGTQDQPAPSPWLVCVEGQVRARCSSWLDQAPGSLFERRAGVFPSMVAGRGQGMRLKWELGPSLGIFCWLHWRQLLILDFSLEVLWSVSSHLSALFRQAPYISPVSHCSQARVHSCVSWIVSSFSASRLLCGQEQGIAVLGEGEYSDNILFSLDFLCL